MDSVDLLVKRIRVGLSTVIIGAMPALPPGITVIRVACDERGTQGPLERARATIEPIAEPRPSWLWGARRAISARNRLGARDAWQSTDAAFVDACNRLAARAPGRVVMVLDGIDAADADTHRMLAGILRQRGRLRLPLVLIASGEPRGSFIEVVQALQDGAKTLSHPDALLASPPSAPTPPPPAPTAAHEAVIPAGVLRVLRAGAVIGAIFDAPLVARLLEMPLEDVLEDLQRARDIGVPVVDRGDGRFVLPDALATALADSILPSLRKRWHERIGELLAGRVVADPTRPPAPRPDPLRAATQLDAAGLPHAALEQRLEAIAAMIDAGDIPRATEAFDRMLTSIESLPASPARSALEMRSRLERARLRWLGGGDEATFSLSSAFDDALIARSMAAPDAPASLRTYMAATLAGIAYDLGDPTALERADAVLVDTISALLQDGFAIDAASLINEQAALRLRRDDVAGAAALLDRARALFEGKLQASPRDESARAELADTDLLLARLPLHMAQVTSRTPSDDVRSKAGYEMALERAKAAERTYELLRMQRELARVWDTMARLEAGLGRTEEARSHFEKALATSSSLEDTTGLARANAGLAELLAKSGRPAEALGLLRASVDSNREKGSVLGLGFDARALTTIERAVERMGGAVDESLRTEVARMRAELAHPHP